MKLIFGILIFILCITTAPAAYSSDLVGASATTTQSSSEILDKNYVQLAISDANLVTVSILETVKTITEVAQNRFYSLLNWQSHQRRQNLEINNYDRTGQFGRWINDSNDDVCFNTRAKVLVRDSIKNVSFKDNNHCVVQSGAWKDPYTTATIKESKAVQIDHFVPLKNAYLSGAYKWSFRARCLYANYLGYDFHLLSVDGIQNMKKGDRSPANYMPPNQGYTCTYVRNWLAIKMVWGLTMTDEEATAIHKIILDNKCNLSKFRMSEKEINSQKQFTKDNIDLCEKIDNSALPK
ncbi:MAG: HNH endonuclease [Bdellovibrio sp.]|nr:HNH endonuclease [Bdellovibrio sp.]